MFSFSFSLSLCCSLSSPTLSPFLSLSQSPLYHDDLIVLLSDGVLDNISRETIIKIWKDESNNDIDLFSDLVLQR